MKNIKSYNKIPFSLLAIFAGLLLSTNLLAQNNPLYDATIRANIDGVRIALAEGADINIQSDNGYTALMWACSYCSKPEYAKVAKYLIAEGADVNICARDGTTAILEAAESSEEVAKLLLEKGADITARRDDGRGIFTSVTFGILMGGVDLEFAGFILSEGGDVNEAATSGDVKGWAAIHYAVSNANKELLRFLAEMGADVNAKLDNGKTPFTMATEAGDEAIIKILKAAGAE